MGEEHAVAAMRTGAWDYLLKDQLARLGPAVRRALDAAALRQREARAELADAPPPPAMPRSWTWPSTGSSSSMRTNTITEFNHAAEQMFGRTRADVLGRPIDDLLQARLSRSASASEAIGCPLTATRRARTPRRDDGAARRRPALPRGARLDQGARRGRDHSLPGCCTTSASASRVRRPRWNVIACRPSPGMSASRLRKPGRSRRCSSCARS